MAVGAVYTIPSGISDILMLRSLKVNLPLSVLAVIIIAELSVFAIAVIILIAIVGKTEIFNSDPVRADKSSLAVMTGLMISILTLVYSKAWTLAAFSITLSAVVIFKEREQTKNLFRCSKLIKGAV